MPSSASTTPRPPRPTLSPYTTLFRSGDIAGHGQGAVGQGGLVQVGEGILGFQGRRDRTAQGARRAGGDLLGTQPLFLIGALGPAQDEVAESDGQYAAPVEVEIGRASCRERVESAGGGGSV